MRGLAYLLAAAIALHSLPALAQGFGQPKAVTDLPRAMVIFDRATGYDDLDIDRHGAPAAPNPTEFGVLMAVRMFRNVCLGLERGESLEAVTPPGFAAYALGSYLLFESEPWQGGAAVVSSTGSLISDEDDGYPAITLIPEPTGMTCGLSWDIYDIPDDRRDGMAYILDSWAPLALALVHADRPELSREGHPRGFADWDRPCLGRWCPTVIFYDFERGSMNLNTTLNITDFEGSRP